MLAGTGEVCFGDQTAERIVVEGTAGKARGRQGQGVEAGVVGLSGSELL